MPGAYFAYEQSRDGETMGLMVREARRALVVIMDGVGDRPIKELGWKTPLQVANKPNLDKVAEMGATGLYDPIAPGIRPGTDTGHLAIFGYDPFKYYPGRGPLEAIGTGIEIKPGDVALRANLATVKEEGGKLIVVDRRAGRIRGEDAEGLVKYLAQHLKEIDGVKVFIAHGTEHRVSIVLRGDDLCPYISDTDPGTAKEGWPVKEAKPTKDLECAKRTAEIVNKLVLESYKLLKDHPINKRRESQGLLPANVLITRGAGAVPKDLKPFKEMYGATAYLVCEEDTVLGIGKLLGMEGEIPPGATGNLDTDMSSILKATLRAIDKGYDIVFTHIKGPDIAGHDANWKGKIEIIEKIDWLVGELLKSISLEEFIVVLTADHTTPCYVRDHTGDPVPIAMAGLGVRIDDVKKYDEVSCARGCLGRIRGVDLLSTVLDLIGKRKKWGA